MGLIASAEGYSTTMVLHLSKLVVTSSVNTKEFLWADTCRVRLVLVLARDRKKSLD